MFACLESGPCFLSFQVSESLFVKFFAFLRSVISLDRSQAKNFIYDHGFGAEVCAP